MKNKSSLLAPFYLTIIAIVSSCSYKIPEHFHVYREVPQEKASVKMPANGIFFLKPFVWPKYFEPPFAFFLYEDGSIISYNSARISKVDEERFWDQPDEYLKSMTLSTNNTGHYKVRGDTIVIETFAINPGRPTVFLKIIRFEGRVINDSAVVIERIYCDWCYSKVTNLFPENGVLPVDNFSYEFYATPVRPDANTVWFKKEKWYQEDVWYNRK